MNMQMDSNTNIESILIKFIMFPAWSDSLWEGKFSGNPELILENNFHLPFLPWKHY